MSETWHVAQMDGRYDSVYSSAPNTHYEVSPLSAPFLKDYLNALEERVRAAEERLAELPTCAACGYFKVLSEGGWCPSCRALNEKDLITSESARQAAEGRAALADEAALRLRERDGYDNFFVAEAGFDFKGRPEADLNFTPAYHDWLARYDALSSPVPAARDGEAEG